MVLDSKQMDWAGREGLDTAALKRAKVPIFGKWYFPDLPANEPLVNLSTGEIEKFPAGYRAGAVLYVKEADLKRAGIGPYKTVAAPAAAPTPAPAPAPAAVAVAAAPAAPTAAPSRPAPAAPAAQAAPVAHVAPSYAGAHAAPSYGAHAVAHVIEHAHPGAHEYVLIALILSVITAVEVAVYYIPAMMPFIFPILIVLSAFKFLLVVGWFMHLKFDHASFRWYFGGGLALALALVLALISLQIATHGTPPGNGNFHVFPETLVTSPPPTSNNPAIAPAAGH